MTTAPLAKSLTTLEGQLTALLVAVSSVAAGIDPHQFPPKWAGVLSAISVIALLVQRGILKYQALTQSASPAFS